MRTNLFLIPTKPAILFAYISLLAILLTGSFFHPSRVKEAYIDPALQVVDSETVSVIVTGEDSSGAAEAIERAGGTVTSDLWIIDAAAGEIASDQIDQIAHMAGIWSIVANHKVDTAASFERDGYGRRNPDGSGDSNRGNNNKTTTSETYTAQSSTTSITSTSDPTTSENTALTGDEYVMATTDPMVYDYAAPVAIDVGAHHLYNLKFPITGDWVGVAVVDSGVYYDRATREVLGPALERQFLAQMDFVGDGSCPGDGFQDLTYCETFAKNSYDPFGHGSHVAGIIANHFTDLNTGVKVGIAPDAMILSIRVLDENGIGTYEDVIEGIQFVVANGDMYDIRVMNLSISAQPSTPYFVDPLNRAVEEAWASGIVVLAAAGNVGPGAETITVPGNDPYIITVGSINQNNTAGDWSDDTISSFSASGPTLDGFVKPDVLAPGSNVVSFMYNDPVDMTQSARLVQDHPDFAATSSLFRMNGTSMSTAVASGVVALMLQANPTLTPDEVKFRLMYTADPAVNEQGALSHSPLQQGAGRIWAPAAVLGENIPSAVANSGLNILDDLAHPWTPGDSPDPAVNPDLAHHFRGPVQRILSDDGSTYLYFVENELDSARIALGAADAQSKNWIAYDTLSGMDALTFESLPISWSQEPVGSAGTYAWSGGTYAWSGGTYAWSGGTYAWSGGTYAWSGGTYAWSGGTYAWSGGTYAWSGGTYAWSGGTYAWSGGASWAGDHSWSTEGASTDLGVSSQTWVD